MAVWNCLNGDATKIQSGGLGRSSDALRWADEDRLYETARGRLQRAAQAVRVAGVDNGACQWWPCPPCLPQQSVQRRRQHSDIVGHRITIAVRCFWSGWLMSSKPL